MFPSPVGGTPFPSDFAPSILFAVLYGLLVPLIVYRMTFRSSRTTLLFGTMAFSIERIVIYSLRAVQSHNESKRVSGGLAIYMQLSFGMGFIGISNDLVNLLRCLLVNSTHGSDTYEQAPNSDSSEFDEEGGLIEPKYSKDFTGAPPPNTPDHPKSRFWFRRLTDFANLAFVSATVPGILANTQYKSTFDNAKQADKTMRLRYASSAVALFLSILLGSCAVWARQKLPRVHKRACINLLALSCLMSIIGIYRLSVMFHTTNSLTSTAPGSLNTRGAKSTFYIFHALPEWLATVVIFGFNIRRMYAAGPFGDWRNHDETEKEKASRLKGKAKRQAKKAAKEAKQAKQQL